jgi:hypothetical protein
MRGDKRTLALSLTEGNNTTERLSGKVALCKTVLLSQICCSSTILAMQ